MLPAAAQDETQLASADTGRKDSSSLPDKHDIEPTKVPKKDTIRFDINLGIDNWLKDLRPHFPDYWTTYANRPNHVYRTHYRGLQGVIHDQIFHQVNRYHKKYLKELWENSTLHPLDLEARIGDYNLERGDSQYRWWNKENWYDFYPIEKGGAGLKINMVGRSRTAFSIGPLDITNTGRVSLSRWRLTIDRVEDDAPIDKDIVNTDIRLDQGKDYTPRPIDGRNFTLGIKPPKGNIYTGDNWTISGSVKVNVKFNLNRNNGTTLRGQLKFRGYVGVRKVPWIEVAVRVTAKPLRNQYSAQLVATLLTF